MKPLGTPLPLNPHAVSMSLPEWQDVVDYEEGSPRVLSALQTGYPRFVYHPKTRELFDRCLRRYGHAHEGCIVLPSIRAAEECAAFIIRHEGVHIRIQPLDEQGCAAILFPETITKRIKSFWQHSGMIISSRLAEHLLGERPLVSDYHGSILQIKKHVSSFIPCSANDTWLFPSGMGAIYTAHKGLIALKPGCKTIQLGFPYVDTLKIQEQFGRGVHFIDYNGENDLIQVEKILKNEKIAGLFCEIPSNPLLQTIDLPALSTLLQEHQVPLLIDDTVGTSVNVDLSPYADLIATSLTKFFSGEGDVLGGSLALLPGSRYYTQLRNQLSSTEELLYGEDAVLFEKNSAGFAMRIRRINQTAEAVCDYLKQHPKVSRVFYPKYTQVETYRHIMKPEGGYGGLFSIILKDPAQAPAVYDALAVDKGPSLGTNFTLACPYTLLAHYQELDFARKSGVAADLIRVSVGLEDTDDLIERFKVALDCI